MKFELDVVRFNVQDVITASGDSGNGEDGGSNGNTNCPPVMPQV